MNKEISRSPKKHEFLLNFTKSPTHSIDQYDFLSVQPHSKDSVNEPDDQPLFHHERLATATDYISGKQHPIPIYFPHSNKSHPKKTSFDHQKDSVTYYQSPPSTTTNAKTTLKSSQSRNPTRSGASQHLNFLNSKEFAKFALSKVLPRDLKRERGIYVELSPPHHGSKGGSQEKRSPKAMLKEEGSKHPKLSAVQAKKQKVKLRASNLTSHDFSSVLDQTRHIHSFINSPQRRNPVQIYLPSTKSTANLRPMSTKNGSHNTKTSWQNASTDALKKLESSQNKKTQNQLHSSSIVHTTEDSKPKERNKGMQSIASILNLRRDKKLSPETKINSCYPVSNYHRKVLSTGCGGAQNSACSQSTNYPPNSHHPISQTASLQEDYKSSVPRSQSHATKSSLSPTKREPGSGKTKMEEESRISEPEVGTEHFASLQQTFEELLDRFKCDIETANESYSTLRKIKEAYQVLATEVFSKLEKNQKEVVVVSQEEKGLKARCERLAQEKMILEEEVRHLRMDNQRLQNAVSERKSKSKERDLSLREESKRSDDEHMESLLTNKHEFGIFKGNEENEELRRLVVSQQNEINELRNKEAKLLDLIYSIHKKGFNVTQLINEEVSRNSEHYEPNFLGSSKRNYESRKDVSGRERENPLDMSDKMEMGSIATSGELSEFILPDSKDLKNRNDVSDAKTSDGTPYLYANTHQALSGMLKNKLKLDFTGLPNNQKNLRLQLDPNNVQQQPDNAEPLGFHDEFMAKIDQFSLSWRLEAMNQRKGGNTDSYRTGHKDLMNTQS